MSTIFTWTRPAIERQLDYWRQFADEIIIGGTGWDWSIELPPEIAAVDPNPWVQQLYDLDYGIGFSVRGCDLACPWCVVTRKEGKELKRVSNVDRLFNPRRKYDHVTKSPKHHIVFLNNNSFAEEKFLDELGECTERGITVNYNQANEFGRATPQIVEALRKAEYRNFNCTKKVLHFAFDSMTRTKRDPETKKWVTYDMMKLVREQILMFKEGGIPPSHLSFYMLVGFNTTLEDDLARLNLLWSFGCDAYVMVFRDLDGLIDVDGKKQPQGYWVKALRRYVNGRSERIPFREFRQQMRAEARHESEKNQLKLF